MRNTRLFAFVAFTLFSLLLMMTFSLPYVVVAQDEDVGTPPVVLTPGAPLNNVLGTPIAPTASFEVCFAAFPLIPGDVIFIEPGTNIRSAPDYSSPIVWNTSYNQVDDRGNNLPELDQVNIEAYISSGPVCMNGYNWWQVRVSGGNDGWVSEGRPTDPGGYLFRTPGIDINIDCTPIFDLAVGETATVIQSVRVRAEPNRNGRVVTVAPIGADVLILGGPVCEARQGLIWFEVQVTVVNFTYTGWMSQGAGGAVWLIPTDLPSEATGTLCGTPYEFGIGNLGYVNSFDRGARHLRDTPGLDGEIRYLLVDGVPFEFIGGPVCENNLNWWNIRVLSSNPVDGWIAEGSSGVGRWLSPLDPNEYER